MTATGRQLRPDPLLGGVIVAEGEGFDLVEAHLAGAVEIEQGRGDAAELHALHDDRLGHSKPGCHVGGGGAVIDQLAIGLELVGGVHRQPDDVFDGADLGRVGVGREDPAVDRMLSGKRAGSSQLGESQVAATAGDNGVFAAGGLAHDERLQQAVCRDRGGQFGDPIGGSGLADIAAPWTSLLKGMVVSDIDLSFGGFLNTPGDQAGGEGGVAPKGNGQHGSAAKERAGRCCGAAPAYTA